MTSELPIYEIEASFRETFRGANACVVTAPTGSGKSTQIPKWLLGELPEGQRAVVLQPRRLAARMLAERGVTTSTRLPVRRFRESPSAVAHRVFPDPGDPQTAIKREGSAMGVPSRKHPGLVRK